MWSFALGSVSPASGQSLPIGFVDEQVIGGLTLPTAFTPLPDGRILITEKDGIVRVLKNGALLSTPFIDLRNSVNDYWDRGLVGIAADQNFVTNHYVYLFYVYENDPADYTGPKTSRLTRVTASGDVAAPATQVTILGTVVGSSCKNFAAGSDCIPADSPSHNGGAIKVADDGTLFVTSGDGASFNVVDDDALRAQDIDSLAGKVLHVTTSGAGLPENPYWNANAAANRSKVWAYGLRNPYRFALHSASRAAFIGDVGWVNGRKSTGSARWRRARTSGWPCYEGPPHQSGYEPKATCQSLYALEPNEVVAPIIPYHHPQNTSSAVTAGVFYPGTTFPAQYRGAFFYGDYAQGFLRYMQVAADGSVAGPVTGFAVGVGGPVYIDTDGENLLYVAINTGEIRRVRYANPNTTNSYLSDRTWTSATNGWGPTERDMSNGENGALDGSVLNINGAIYAKGLGVNSPSDIRYALGGSCTAFAAVVGMDDDTGSGGTVVFQVYTDGRSGTTAV